MKRREKTKPPTLVVRLGDVSHVSPLLRKVERLSGCPAEMIPAWLLKYAHSL